MSGAQRGKMRQIFGQTLKNERAKGGASALVEWLDDGVYFVFNDV